MIVAKPKFNSVFSIAVFLILVFAAFAYTAYEFFVRSSSSLYVYFGMVFSGALGLGLLLKLLWNWKTVTIAKERFEVHYPFRFKKMVLAGKNLRTWEEINIKTWGGQYAELTLLFDNKKKITLSKQEHTDYAKAINYLVKKFKQKQKGK